jgi:hypothetical protein
MTNRDEILTILTALLTTTTAHNKESIIYEAIYLWKAFDRTITKEFESIDSNFTLD